MESKSEVVKYGIKETKELVKFIVEFAEAIDASLMDGEIGFGDISNLVSSMLAAGAAFDNAHLIPKELKDLDQTEALELYTYIKTELNLQHAKVEEVAERAIEIGLKVFELAALVRAPSAPMPSTPAA